ncbi:unnamed protein product [Hymenolepis diminuta]|uniref:Wntless-like transmembrane domain-containing protein n=1 Tax=Hymenolepis diminuta TaxID=6216 RepID=A0A3P6ZFX2_HYMDI|nr:unnamed protein product [Hymenolepis diminuta]
MTVNISVLCRTYPDKISAADDSEPDAGNVIAIEKYQKNVTLVCMEGMGLASLRLPFPCADYILFPSLIGYFQGRALKKPCNEIPLIHIGQLKCAAYTFKVRFLGLLAQKDDSDVEKIRKSRAVLPKTASLARHRRRMITSSVKADDISNNNDDENAIDTDVGADNSIENTNVDGNDNQSSDNEDDNSEPKRDETKPTKKNINDVKISVADDIPDAQFGPVMEEENKETNNPVVPNFAIKEIEFITQTRNPTFSYFEMFSRVGAFLAAFGLFFIFFTSMNAFGWEHWTVEQKWTSMILLLLLFYYDPFHPLMYLLPGWIPGALDSFLAISFYTYLLLFWISVFDSLRGADTSCLCFYCPRFLITTSIWLLCITFNGWVLHREYTDPLFNVLQHTTALKIFLALSGILAFVYLLYFFVQLFRSYSELKAMPYYSLRLTLLLIPILFSTANFLIIMGVRFSPTGSVFFLRSPTTELIHPNSTNEVQRPFTSSCSAFPAFRSSFELSLNFGIAFSFCLLMALTYSPTRTALAEANYKDNPSVSLAHESDEDVLYGSDHDDIHLRTR